jgi:hypothetical protein
VEDAFTINMSTNIIDKAKLEIWLLLHVKFLPSKLKNVDFEEFSLIQLPTWMVLYFCQGVFKD